MGMSENYGPSNDTNNLTILARALELGINFFGTADSYGPFRNEELIGRFLQSRSERIIVATKFGFVRSEDPTAPIIDNSPAYIRSACEASLRRLAIDVIDICYVHRIDPARPIEETIQILAALVRAGKVRSIGLSEVSASTSRRAAAVHPIAAVQSEYSLWAREAELDVLPSADEFPADVLKARNRADAGMAMTLFPGAARALRCRRNEARQLMKIIAVTNIKGGVGKTTPPSIWHISARPADGHAVMGFGSARRGDLYHAVRAESECFRQEARVRKARAS